VSAAAGSGSLQGANATANPRAAGFNDFYTGTRFLVKAGTKIKSIDDLKGKTIVSTTGTTNYKILRNLNEEKKLGMDLLAAKDHAESALMVESGRAAAFGMDDILLYGLRASAQNPASLAVVTRSGSSPTRS
jgi:glutamate/aspartate transport system substrate-binding protein